MKIVIPGGTGQLGQLLAGEYVARGHDVVVLSRTASNNVRTVVWDGQRLGAWADEIDRCDVVINLAGRTVNCRYTAANLKAMMDSRVDSTRIVGEAIARAKRPPRVWLQMSTATIYAHRFDAANDELTGQIGGNEPGVPKYWGYSVEIAHAWENAQAHADTPHTRKVALRTAMVMATGADGVFEVLTGLVRKGLGGAAGGGSQFVSWIHEQDFVRAIDFVIEHDELVGALNVCAPNPVPHREFMAALRAAAGIRVGLPATRWMLEIGAFFMRTDTELLLKSRRVVPARLQNAGFAFSFPDWRAAADDLISRHALSDR